MRDNDDIHDAVQNGFCEGCKGSIGCGYADLWLECDGYRDEYDAIEKEWAEEARLQTEPREEYDQ